MNTTTYGLDKYDIKQATQKIEKQKAFLNKHYIRVGSKDIYLSEFTKNAYINSDRYIAEVNHRVWSLYHYANNNNLKNIFLTITLPSEYHPKIKNKYKNPKFIDDSDHTPKAGARELSKIYKRLLDLRAYRNIDKSDKCYFRVYEPHKDGTPHLHSSIFVPIDTIDDVVASFQNFFDINYPGLQIKIETNINNPVAYLMKYILKTFDDLRDDKEITALSLWYTTHKITRFYTSRTLVSLDIYRVLGGRYSLIELTRMYKDQEISVFLEPDTRKVIEVFDRNMCIPIWTRRYIQQEFKPNKKVKIKYLKKDDIASKNLQVRFTDLDGNRFKVLNNQLIPISKYPVKPICKQTDMNLYNHFKKMDQSLNLNFDIKHYGLVKNELINRGLIDGDIISVNQYSFEFDDIF